MPPIYKRENTGSDIFILPTSALGFFRWLNHTLEKIQPKAGRLSSSWEEKPEAPDKRARLNLARVVEAQDSSELDLLLEICVVPIHMNRTFVELVTIQGKHGDLAYVEIKSRIERSWPEGNPSRSTYYKRAEPLAPFDLQSHSEQENIGEIKHHLRGERQTQNRGGHPALKCNEWAYREINAHPLDRKRIYEQWAEKYKEELGPEVIGVRDLPEAFRKAMGYRRGKEIEQSKSSNTARD